MKIKEALLKEQENLLEYYSEFYECLERFQANSLTSDELDEMERKCSKNLSIHSKGLTKSISNKTIKVVNNIDYSPKQGA